MGWPAGRILIGVFEQMDKDFAGARKIDANRRQVIRKLHVYFTTRLPRERLAFA